MTEKTIPAPLRAKSMDIDGSFIILIVREDGDDKTYVADLAEDWPELLAKVGGTEGLAKAWLFASDTIEIGTTHIEIADVVELAKLREARIQKLLAY